MSDDPKNTASRDEIESLNERVLDANEATLEELEQVSGGDGVELVGGTCDSFSGTCGGFSGHCGTF